MEQHASSSCVQVPAELVTSTTGPSISRWVDFTSCVGGTRELRDSPTHVAHLAHASIACENRPIEQFAARDNSLNTYWFLFVQVCYFEQPLN